MIITEELLKEIQNKSGMYNLSPIQEMACIVAYNFGIEKAAMAAKVAEGRGDPMGPFGTSNYVDKESILNLKITNLK